VDLEFKNRDADTVDDAELLEDRIRSLELRLHLHMLNVPKVLKRRVRVDGYNSEKLFQPMESETGFECPVCLPRIQLPS
jgi:hypothetical protein